MLELRENVLDTETYFSLREQVGWVKLSEVQAQKAIDNCLFNVCAYIDGEPVGMGRVVGDGAVVCYIQDLVVIPKAQKTGVGGAILNRLKEYVRSITEEDTTMMLCLMCAKGREEFYIKHGFIDRPTDKLGPGMITYIQK
jgi:GNAT superfamily N-acetyltransferase